MIPRIWTLRTGRDLRGIMREDERRRLVRDEFSGVDLGDKRRSRRAVAIAERLASNPEASLPDAMGERSATEGIYRHLGARQVTFESLLQPHIARTAERVCEARVAFAVSDTTDFQFTGEKRRAGLGPINTMAQGFLAHVTVAVSADGRKTPLGLLACEMWARAELKHRRRHRTWQWIPDPARESLRWWRGMKSASERATGSELIHVADRDSDIYGVLAQLVTGGHRFIVRAAQDRSLVPLDKADAKRLFDAARSTPTKYEVDAPVSARSDGTNRPTDLKRRRPKRGSRTASLSVAARSVTLTRPAHADRALPERVTVNVVHALELGAPLGQAPVEWLLLTGEPIATDEQVAFVLEGYRTRWIIEEYFKAIKTGCSFESKQLESFHTLSNMLAFVLVVAYVLLLLRTLTNTSIDERADQVLSRDQIAILRACSPRPLPKALTIREALLSVAALGGHIRNNGDPGWRVLSRGWRKLADYERGFAIARARSDQS